MERINLTKYGFKRWPEEDFTDDGSKFTCYKVGERVRVSKTSYEDQVYISARIDSSELPYEMYSNLSHYRELDRLNGINKAAINEDDIQKLYEDCLSYEAEYNEALKNVVYPTVDEIKAQQERIRKHYRGQYDELNEIIKENASLIILSMDDYDLKYLRRYMRDIKGYTEVKETSQEQLEQQSHSAWGITFVKPNNSSLTEHWYYDRVMEILQKYCFVG